MRGHVLLQCHAAEVCHELAIEGQGNEWCCFLARYGIRGLVIDPYNELDHQRPAQMNETEYVSQMLTKIKRFAQHHDVHVWFVAHPRQMRDWKGDPPNLYDISGSAHFINKCDNGIVVHRSRDPNEDPRLVGMDALCWYEVLRPLASGRCLLSRVHSAMTGQGAGEEGAEQGGWHDW